MGETATGTEGVPELHTRAGLIATIATEVIAAGLLAIIGVHQFTTRPTVDPLQPSVGGSINPEQRTIVVGTPSYPMMNVGVTVDGTDLTDTVGDDGDGIVVSGSRLGNGRLGMSVSSPSGNLFDGEVHREWEFTVDRATPPLVIVLMGRTIVHIDSRTLTLYRDGKMVTIYGVAMGQPAYPTPTEGLTS
ncbi:MAG: murein L,D-transpeptidase [Thermoleophilia bacterium]|nr:murein L,D-transpeptidase [Thermoleophilia bacterium]